MFSIYIKTIIYNRFQKHKQFQELKTIQIFNIIHILNNFTIMVTLYPYDWVSDLDETNSILIYISH